MSEHDTPFSAALNLQKAGKLSEAESLYLEAWRIKPTLDVLVNLGSLYREQCRFVDSEKVLRFALRNRPDSPYVNFNLGNLYWHTGRLEEAEVAYRSALRSRPQYQEALAALGITLLSQGCYSEGWRLHEYRKERLKSSLIEALSAGAIEVPEWRGEDPTGKSFIIWGEQGLGDQIQTARYVGELRRRGASRVAIVCNSELCSLFDQLEADEVISNENPVSVSGYDYWALSFSLPRWLGFCPSVYLRAPDVRAKGCGEKIGVVYRGSPNHPNDANRSIFDRSEIRELKSISSNVMDIQGPTGSMAESASKIAGLKLLITVDTSWAHLAGAMGIPVWVLLPALGTDWRWGRGLDVSPWYPTVRLYRQEKPGDWRSVIYRLKGDINSI